MRVLTWAELAADCWTDWAALDCCRSLNNFAGERGGIWKCQPFGRIVLLCVYRRVQRYLSVSLNSLFFCGLRFFFVQPGQARVAKKHHSPSGWSLFYFLPLWRGLCGGYKISDLALQTSLLLWIRKWRHDSHYPIVGNEFSLSDTCSAIHLVHFLLAITSIA